MSGREHEPIAAFFPSIDRNLMRDLDRHLRHAPTAVDAPALKAAPDMRQGSAALPPGPPPQRPSPQQPLPHRPSIDGIVEAVEHAAQSIANMTHRIQEIEQHRDDLQAENQTLDAQLNDAAGRIDDLDARFRAEEERASRAEAQVAEHMARASALERELALAHADLVRVTEAIASTLGVYQHETV